jgi:hypothetical protein
MTTDATEPTPPSWESLAAAFAEQRDKALAENARLRQQRDEARDEGIAWRVRLADGLSARGLPPSTDSVAAALAELDARSAHIRSDGRYIQELVAERDALQATLNAARKECDDLAHANVMRIGEWENERRQVARLLGAPEDGTWLELKQWANHVTSVIVGDLLRDRDRAQATLGDLRAAVQDHADGLRELGEHPTALLEQTLIAVANDLSRCVARAALDSVPTQTPGGCDEQC